MLCTIGLCAVYFWVDGSGYVHVNDFFQFLRGENKIHLVYPGHTANGCYLHLTSRTSPPMLPRSSPVSLPVELMMVRANVVRTIDVVFVDVAVADEASTCTLVRDSDRAKTW